MTLVIIACLAVSLFALAYLTKRRFGVLGLALAAGLVLSQELGRFVAPLLKAADVPVQPLAYSTTATVILVLAPALILLLAGPKYHGKHKAFVGSVLFSMLGTVLLLGPLTRDLPGAANTPLAPVMGVIAQYSSFLVVVGIVLALLDTLHMHTTKFEPKKHKH